MSSCEASQLLGREDGCGKHWDDKARVAFWSFQRGDGLLFRINHYIRLEFLTTYWAWDIIFSTRRGLTRFVAFVLKGMQIDMPFDIKTPLQEVTFVIEKALLDLSNLLWWWTLIFSSVSRIFCILWLFYSASKFAALSTEFFGDLGDV